MNTKYEPVEFHGKGDYLELATGKIYYEIEGHGPLLIIVPGGPGSNHTHYHPWFSKLAVQNTVIYFDQSGTGRSDRLEAGQPYTLAQYAWEIDQLRIHLGFEKTAVIGISFGSLPAIEYATNYSNHLSHLIVSNGHLNAQTWQQGNIDNVNSELQKLYPLKWQKIVELRRNGIKSDAEEYQDLYSEIMPNLYWANHWERPELFSTGDPREKMNMDVYLSFVGDDPEWEVSGTLKDYDPANLLKKIEAPSLVMTGRLDRVTPPIIAHQLLESLPTDRTKIVVFEKSAHRPWIEEPDKYFKILGEFLNGEFV